MLLLAASDPYDKSTPDVALPVAALSTDSIPQSWYESMSVADQYEYHALFLDEHSTLVDWHEKRKNVSSDALLASSPNCSSHMKLSIDTGDFILDSGATIHISPDTSDFYNLKPILLHCVRHV